MPTKDIEFCINQSPENSGQPVIKTKLGVTGE